ncbi:hypothetical protein J7J26_00240 [Candidatus Micrarchaeota archaeon]|nr:hypothetical protein [Candidatus Micrarchaeota archaeon]
MSIRGILYVLLGIVLIAIGISLLVVYPIFWESFKTVIIGSIPVAVVFIGLIVTLIGRELGKLDDFQKNLDSELKNIEENETIEKELGMSSMEPERTQKAKKKRTKKRKIRKRKKK